MNLTGIKKRNSQRSKVSMAFGYVHELISDEIPDPVAYYTDFVAEKNKERAAAFTEELVPVPLLPLWNITWDNFFCIRF